MQRADVEESIEASGTLAALSGQDAKLGVLVPGRISELRVAEGARSSSTGCWLESSPLQFRNRVTQASRLTRTERAFRAGVASGQLRGHVAAPEAVRIRDGLDARVAGATARR